MKVTGTREAFLKMLETPAVNKILGVSAGTASAWKAGVLGTGDRPPTIDKMEEMLQKYGAEVVREKVWKMPE